MSGYDPRHRFRAPECPSPMGKSCGEVIVIVQSYRVKDEGVPHAPL